jgi:hypothetical protein
LNKLSLVTQEIRYRLAGAEEVWLVWGINGWQSIPEEARPSNTVLKDNAVMHSRMARTGDRFVTTVRVPPDTMLEYKFLITKTSRGRPVNLWQDLSGQAYWKRVRTSGSLEETATVTVVTPEERQAWLAGQAADLPLVTQDIRYHAPGAGEVWLLWGLDGWRAAPEAARPPDTMVKDKLLHSRMARHGDTFTVPLRVPPGVKLDLTFLITKTDDGKPVQVRQEKDGDGQALSRVVSFDDVIKVRSLTGKASLKR